MHTLTRPQTNRSPVKAGTEQHTCPRCSGGVATEHVSVTYPKSMTRVTRVFCEHCDRTSVATHESSGGAWQLAGRVESMKGCHLGEPAPAIAEAADDERVRTASPRPRATRRKVG